MDFLPRVYSSRNQNSSSNFQHACDKLLEKTDRVMLFLRYSEYINPWNDPEQTVLFAAVCVILHFLSINLVLGYFVLEN